MKDIFLQTLIFIFIVPISCSKRNTELISAFSSIITELFLTPQIPFDVIIYKSKSRKSFDIIDGIGSQLSGKILRISQAQNWTHKLTQSAVIFTQNEKDLSEFLNKTELKNVVVKPLRFLIHSSEKIELEKLKIPPLNFDKGHIGHFSYFVIETLKEIQLKTFEWFTEEFCDVQQTIVLKNFDKKKLKWKKNLRSKKELKNLKDLSIKENQKSSESSKNSQASKNDKNLKTKNVQKTQNLTNSHNNSKVFQHQKSSQTLKISPKFKNFHGCSLYIYSGIFLNTILETTDWINYGFTFSSINIPLKKSQIHPFEREIIKTVATHGNFTPNVTFDASENLYHIYYLHRTPIYDDDYSIGSIVLDDFETFLTSPSEPYDSYEKMIFPFDLETWSCLFGYFVIAFVAILIINRMPKKYQTFVYGEGINDPSLNVIKIFFGIGPTKTPENNSARILLIFYIYFCMVISTAYQGKSSLFCKIIRNFFLKLKLFLIFWLIFFCIIFRRLLRDDDNGHAKTSSKLT
jgi:hypothetical protein